MRITVFKESHTYLGQASQFEKNLEHFHQ